jgi:peptidyl-tRNA hydrolase, PTH1 family
LQLQLRLLQKQLRLRTLKLSNTFLVVGLGNPGPNYALNRHNVGQMLLDVVAARFGETFKAHKSNALVAEVKIIGGPKLILAKPLSFMNLSGGPTSSLMSFYKLDPESLIVAHDELDIPPASFRLKQGGGHGGHNGIRDIISAIDTNDFARIRLGIGRPPGTSDAADYVLKNFSSSEKTELAVTLEIAADALEEVARNGIVAAQGKYHAPTESDTA